jgi:hypothetical protein
MSCLIRRSRPRWLPGVLLLFALVLGGCATQTHTLLQSTPPDLQARRELSGTPFFPQELYQCGPAALATALQTAGIAATPDELVSQVYVPARQGSLQTEMIAAARRNGALGMTLPPRLDALLYEVAAGTPVIVLQNLSLPAFPLWHYAVVIGYDLDRAEVILRSGTTERLAMPLTTFERTWARGGHWAMVALPPGRLPVTAEEGTAVPALVALEKATEPKHALLAYRAALRRWPDNLLLQLGLGNSAYASGDLQLAADALRRATVSHPDSAPAFNNLATVLAELGDYAEARSAAERAIELGGQWAQIARATLESIARSRPSAGR